MSHYKNLIIRHCAYLGIAASLFVNTGYAIDPTTLKATATEAKELAGEAKDFLEFIGYMPSKPNPLDGLPQKLGTLQTSVDRIDSTTKATLEVVHRLEDNAVRVENEKALNDLLDTMEHVTAARISLAYLADNPKDSNLLRDADVASRIAIQDFETRPGLFRVTGPLISDQRFNHLPFYAAYLDAAVLRAAFIQMVNGLTRDPYRSELLTTAEKLRKTVKNILNALEIRTQVFGNRSPVITCTSASLTLIDNILYHKGTAKYEEAAENPSNQTVQSVNFPGDSCDDATVNFYLEEPMETMRNERANLYGAVEISTVAELLSNYATYGQASPPQFPNWFSGSLFNTVQRNSAINPTYHSTFIPEDTATLGAKVVLVGAERSQEWKFAGSWIIHYASNLCLRADVNTNARVCPT